MAALGLVVMLASCLWLYVLAGLPTAIAGGAFLSVATARFYLATHYVLDDVRIEAQRPGFARSLAWEDVRAWWEDDDGALVSPCLDSPLRARARGIMLDYPADDALRPIISNILRASAGRPRGA